MDMSQQEPKGNSLIKPLKGGTAAGLTAGITARRHYPEKSKNAGPRMLQ